MYLAEHILQSLTYKELYYTLRGICDEDYYLQEFLNNDLQEEFLYMLDVYDIVFIASDDRILLTSKGEKILQHVSKIVEFEKFSHKLQKRKIKRKL